MFNPDCETKIDDFVFPIIMDLLKTRALKKVGRNVLEYEHETMHHNGAEYLGSTILYVLIERKITGTTLTFTRSYETDYEATYQYYINEEQVSQFLARKINRYFAGKDVRELSYYKRGKAVFDC